VVSSKLSHFKILTSDSADQLLNVAKVLLVRLFEVSHLFFQLLYSFLQVSQLITFQCIIYGSTTLEIKSVLGHGLAKLV
jgi:hypothetical protein